MVGTGLFVGLSQWVEVVITPLGCGEWLSRGGVGSGGDGWLA